MIKKTSKTSKIKKSKKTVALKKGIVIKKVIKPIIKKVAVKKRASATAFTRSLDNPIISPQADNNWESWQTFNPGVILLDNKIYFLYRAVGEDGISRFGYAMSEDGFSIDERLPFAVYEHKVDQQPSFNIFSYFSGGSFGGAEDPRLVRVNKEDTFYVTYTACDNGLRVALTSIKISDFLSKKWKWQKPKLISPPDELHKNWLIFPEKINGKYAILHNIVPKIEIAYVDDLDFKEEFFIYSSRAFGPQRNGSKKKGWDKWLRGTGAPPLKTKYGWLLFYHAMDNDWSKYKVGAMLLDLNNPTKVLYRSEEPVLEPEACYENNGSKAGIVYASGAIVKDGLLFLYYGGSDSYVCVACAPFDNFVEALVKGAKPRLRVKQVKTK